MSAILIAAFNDHAAASNVRTRLTQEGFPTDRVYLVSRQEPGQAALVPRNTLEEQLTEYLRTLFQGSYTDGESYVEVFKRAVLDNKGVVAVHPRGATETQQALQIFNDAGAIDLKGADLQNQPLEHAAGETSALTWMGKVLAGPGAPDTTGVPKLPDPL